MPINVGRATVPGTRGTDSGVPDGADGETIPLAVARPSGPRPSRVLPKAGGGEAMVLSMSPGATAGVPGEVIRRGGGAGTRPDGEVLCGAETAPEPELLCGAETAPDPERLCGAVTVPEPEVR